MERRRRSTAGPVCLVEICQLVRVLHLDTDQALFTSGQVFSSSGNVKLVVGHGGILVTRGVKFALAAPPVACRGRTRPAFRNGAVAAPVQISVPPQMRQLAGGLVLQAPLSISAGLVNAERRRNVQNVCV